MSDKKKDDALATAGEAAVDTGEYADIRQRVQDNRKRVEEAYWNLAQDLHEVYNGSMYLAWGFENWRDYVEKELDFRVRKAQYLVSIFDWFGDMKPNVQKWIKELGWTKAKELVSIVTAENAAEWKKKLVGKSVKEIVDLIKGGGGEDDGEEGGEGEGGGEGGGEGSGESSGADDSKPTKMSFTFFAPQRLNVDKALEKAMEMGETDKPGHAMDLICTEFLSTNVGIDDLEAYLDKIQKVTGVRLVAFAAEEDEVVFGGELLDEIAGGDDDADGEEKETTEETTE